MIKNTIKLILFLNFIYFSALSQVITPGDDNNKATTVDLDLSTPASPGFTVIGVSPENIIRPTNPRVFAASLLNAVDQNGNLQNGLAIDATPFLGRTTLAKYKKNYISRLLANTQISIATTKGQSEEDKSSKIGAGIHLTLLNHGDPRLNKALLDDLKNIVIQDPLLPSEDTASYDKRIATTVNSVFEKYRSKAESKPIWIIAGAPSFITPTGNVDNLQWNGFGIWTSFGFGFGKNSKSQFIVHARYRGEEKIATPNEEDEYIIQNSSLLGGRFRTGNKNLKYSLEAGYTITKPEGLSTDYWTQFAIVLEPRVFKDLWLHLSLTGQGGRDGGNDIGFRTAINYSFDRVAN